MFNVKIKKIQLQLLEEKLNKSDNSLHQNSEDEFFLYKKIEQ